MEDADKDDDVEDRARGLQRLPYAAVIAGGGRNGSDEEADAEKSAAELGEERPRNDFEHGGLGGEEGEEEERM